MSPEKLKLIIIDDEAENMTLVSALLKNDFHIVKIHSGAQALKIAEQEKPDLILLDLNMPNINGLEVLQQFKNNPTTMDIPVFCLSADSSKENQKMTHELGAAGYFHKPIDAKNFRNDLIAVFESFNIRMSSVDQKTFIKIAYNHKIKKERILKLLRSVLSNQKVIFISMTQPQFYIDTELHQYIASEKLYYLQVKPEILSRLSYIQDVSIFLDDLNTLVVNDTSDFILVIDELDQLFNIYDNMSVVSHFLRFSEIAKTRFKTLYFFSVNQSSSVRQEKLYKSCKLLIGAI